MSKPTLKLELIPKLAQFSNVRTMIKPSEWDKIRKLSYKLANGVCEVCGDTGKNQGYKHDLECHEVWFYDDENKIQILNKLISLCPLCHLCVHYGRARTTKKKLQCRNHIKKINKWTLLQVDKHILDSFELHKERSKYYWKLDISILNEKPYLLKLDLSKQRKFIKKKFKKKKKPNLMVRVVKKKSKNRRPPKKK